MAVIRDCSVCFEGEPLSPGLKCCFNCARDPGSCDVTHSCGKDCPVWTAKTNADRIRSMDDEELSALLCFGRWGDHLRKECLEWLKQPAEDFTKKDFHSDWRIGMQYNYEDCLSFVRYRLGLQLFPYQEEMLKAFCEGKEVRTARCMGRTYVAKAFGQYVASLYDVNDYTKDPDVVFPYTCAIKDGLLTEQMVDIAKMRLSDEAFKRDFLCE